MSEEHFDDDDIRDLTWQLRVDDFLYSSAIIVMLDLLKHRTTCDYLQLVVHTHYVVV